MGSYTAAVIYRRAIERVVGQIKDEDARHRWDYRLLVTALREGREAEKLGHKSENENERRGRD